MERRKTVFWYINVFFFSCSVSLSFYLFLLLVQGSHGFITQHRWAKNISTFINLDACGAGGQEILFQTGPNASVLPQVSINYALIIKLGFTIDKECRNIFNNITYA